MKYFSQKDVSIVNYDIIVHFAGTWSLAGMMIYAYFIHHQILLLLLAALLICFPPGYKYLYYKWLLFKYDKTTSLSIDFENRLFIYSHDNKVISFTSSDIERWSWNEYGPFLFLCKFIQIIELRLKDGTIITLSNGIDNHIIGFFMENREVLSLPYGEQAYGYDLQSYIEKIE